MQRRRYRSQKSNMFRVVVAAAAAEEIGRYNSIDSVCDAVVAVVTDESGWYYALATVLML